MIFLTASMLLGLAAVAIPIVIHLLNRSKPRPVEWGAMQFLIASMSARNRRIQIEDGILLCLRCLGLALLALAMARPFIPSMSAMARRWLTAGVHDTAIILDASLSMNLTRESRSNFSRAVEEANALIAASRPDDAFTLILGGPVPQPLIPRPTSDRRELQRALKDPACHPVRGNMATLEALNLAGRLLAGGPNAAKTVIIFTDGHAAGWDSQAEARWQFVAGGFKGLPSPPQVMCRRFPIPESFRNVAVSEIHLVRDVVGTDRPVQIDVTLVNAGTTPIQPAAVELSVDGHRIARTPVLKDLLPHTSEVFPFIHKFETPGNHLITAQVTTEDDLAADNTLEQTVHILDRVPVLLVEGAPSERFFFRKTSSIIRSALAPHVDANGQNQAQPEMPFLISPTIAEVNDIAVITNLSPYHVVILADVSRLPAAVADRLDAFVKSGGGLLILPGNRAEPDFYNTWLTPSGEPMVPAQLSQRIYPADPVRLDPRSFTHPALRLVSQPEQSDARFSLISSYWKLDVDPSSARVRIGGRFSTREPWLVERQLGKGYVLMTSMAFDRQDSNISSLKCFVPLVHELVYFLTAPTLINCKPAQGQPAESSLTLLTNADLAAIRRHVNVLIPGSLDELLQTLSGKIPGQELWKILVLCVILTWLAEMALTRWITLHRRLRSSNDAIHAMRNTRIALSTLRAAVVLAAIIMLFQPVLVFNSSRNIQRHVVALLDVSASMQIPDNNLTPAEARRLPAPLQSRAATLRRSELALHLLQGQKNGPGLLERLDNKYGVNFYTFGAFPIECRIGDMAESNSLAKIRAPPDRQIQSTDIAAALEKATTDLLPEQTAGIILLTDGRHNTAMPVEPLASKLGDQHIPIFPVVFGESRCPPTDAIVVSVDAPESVSTNDRIAFTVDLALNGLSGSNVTTTLFDGPTAVASNTVTPDSQTFRQQLQLSTVPQTGGLHYYRVEVAPFTSEVDTNNNACNIPVQVNGDPIKVLLIDGYPRWEFRYLKNLFMERDQNVRLQYLLFHPDQITGIPHRLPRAASAAPGQTEVEATLPPANEGEWMKFDVIILGDVDPQELGYANMDILRRYVTDRGGSLVILAGPRHMPHAYAHTPLSGILPVTVHPSLRPLMTAPEPEFRLALTTEGRNAAFMKLDDAPQTNLEIWNNMPSLHWRNGSMAAKEGATVLAYAVAPLNPSATNRDDSVPSAESLLQQQQQERDNALLVAHYAGLGSVLMCGFDQSWRFRFRKGDLYHYKYWGQVLRWATADRIASGSAPLRIGTTRPRYPTGNPVVILARLATPELMPVINATPYATVWNGDKKVLRRQLAYRPESPGIYTAEADSLPEGQYRVELDCSGITTLGSVPAQPISADFSVIATRDAERIEYTADRGLLSRLASLTSGKVLEPSELDTVFNRLGPASVSCTERHQVDIWDSWPWFIMILALLTAEWILRKKARLP